MKCFFNSIIFSLLLLTSFLSNAQDSKSKTALVLLANDAITDVNIHKDQYISSISKLTEKFDEIVKEFPKDQQFGLLYISHNDKAPSLELFANPTLSKEKEFSVLAALAELPYEKTILLDFPIFLAFNSTPQDFPTFQDPTQTSKKTYANASFEEKVRLNKEYAIQEVIPVLAAFEASVDDQFKGVKNFGKLIQTTDFGKAQDINLLTSKNADYWQATMEMGVGNQLIPVTKIALLVSQGEFDLAFKYIEIIPMFSNPKSVAHAYVTEMKERLELFQIELNKQVDKGIVQHDQSKFDDALNIYSDLLAIYPNSSWALYEKYYSTNTRDLLSGKITAGERASWDEAKVEIYKHNPLYSTDIRASTGKEIYLLFRRQEVSNLFKSKANTIKDVVTYADIATDLEVYDFAAQLYWLSALHDKDNAQNIINHYLYCLEKLEVKGLKVNFKGDFDKIFKTIDKERITTMENNSMYKAMKDK